MIRLLLATNNRGKLIELRSLLSGLDLILLSPEQVGLDLQVKETGTSYHENAVLKAKTFAEAAQMWSLADDTGLEVETLDGAPGLYSARYAPQVGATDKDRRDFLLQNLKKKPPPWIAAFRCTVAICDPDGTVLTEEAICPGEIIPIERGAGGFGYDPIFLLAESGSTMAELDMDRKNQLSHRGQAVRKMVPHIKEFILKG